jgi:hypothetical protein
MVGNIFHASSSHVWRVVVGGGPCVILWKPMTLDGPGAPGGCGLKCCGIAHHHEHGAKESTDPPVVVVLVVVGHDNTIEFVVAGVERIDRLPINQPSCFPWMEDLVSVCTVWRESAPNSLKHIGVDLINNILQC